MLWGCVCFLPQKGCNIAHGYSVSNHAEVLGPQTSNQFHSGASLNSDHDSVSPMDDLQNFDSLQREPVHYENNEDASSVTSFGEENPESEHEPDEFSVDPSMEKYLQESAGDQHPFGLLVKEHKQKTSMEGVSFPTMKDFKHFIETIKSSFLKPGSDLSGHFQTEQDMMENEVTSNAQNIKSEPNDHDGVSENNVWSEPVDTTFYQMQSESLSVPDPVDSMATLLSTSVYDNQDSGSGSALYPFPHSTASEYVSSNYGNFDKSGENPDIFTSSEYVQNEDVPSTSYELPEQIPSGSFFSHVTESPANPPNNPSQEFSYYPSKTSNIMPLVSNGNIKQPIYTSHSEDSLTGYQKPSGGFEFEDFQSQQLGRVTPANVVSAPKPPLLNSYAKSVYVNAPRGHLNILSYPPKLRERPAPSFQAYQPTIGKESKYINNTPTVQLPASSGSVSSRSDNLSPQRSNGHVGAQTSSPHDAEDQMFNRKQPVLSPQEFIGSSRYDGYLGDQRIGVTRPSSLSDQAKDEERSGLSELNPVSGISSQVGVGYVSFNSLTNLAPTSLSETALSILAGNEVTSRDFGIKNIISNRFQTGNIRDARNTLGSFSTPQKRGISLNDATSFLQKFIQPTKVRKPRKPPSGSKATGSVLSGVFRRNGGNTKRLRSQTGPSVSQPSVNAYIVQSRNAYVRSKVSQSNTRYAPYQLDGGKTGTRQRKPAPMLHKY
ncbi:uncharacterized protein LOC127353614 isoform X2 [Dicentrarchus labrax]|nr:uncharacterized protein LOC127353614 isoform X2 [Dicentrarchus labrax]